MKALIYKDPYHFKMDEIEEPVIVPGAVKIKIHSVGACGSDVHGFAGKTGRRYSGMVMGHEISGEVTDIGEGVTGFSIGQHVVVQPIIYCGECIVCREGKTSICLNKKMVGINMDTVGGLSEYIIIPAKNVFPIAPVVPYETAILVEPFAVGAGAIANSGIREGDSIAIVGAGMIGLTILLMALERKPSQIFIIDMNERKLETAEKMGAIPINFTKTDPIEEIHRLTQGIGVDVGIEAVGLPASVKTAVSVVRPGGTVVWIGNSAPEVVVNMQDVVVKAKKIQGVYCYNDGNFQQAISFVENNCEKIAFFVEETVDLENAETLFTDIAKGKKDYFRAVVNIKY